MKSLKFFLTILILLTFSPSFSNSIDKAIENTNLKSHSVISVAVKDSKTAENVYSRRAETCLNPASTLKIFTMASALNTLGEKYNFETVVYILDKDLYLKLGGDPLLTKKDLDTLAKNIKQAYGGSIRHFYIDDSIIDKVYYPDGWTVDDFWPNSPKISPYIVDNNTVKINFAIQEIPNGKKNVVINQNDSYKFSFINELTVSDVTKITPSFNYGETSGIVSLRGTVSSDFSADYPVLNTAQFFAVRLRKALDDNGVSYSKPFYPKRVPDDAKRIASFSRPLGEVLTYILSTSNNFGAEVVFKVAGGFWARDNEEYIKSAYLNNGDNKKIVVTPSLGNFENARKMFLDYYKKAGLDVSKVKISDGSGVSRYNTLSANWIADGLVYLNQNSKIKEFLPTADTGTLSRRMRDLKGNLKAKTGTIFGTSSLAGYITSINDVEYVFSIIIQNLEARPSLMKGLEDDIVQSIYYL